MQDLVREIDIHRKDCGISTGWKNYCHAVSELRQSHRWSLRLANGGQRSAFAWVSICCSQRIR